MVQPVDLDVLGRWLTFDLSPATAHELAKRPGFAEAGRALNRAKVEVTADPVMAVLTRDAGHYVTAALTFGLHQEDGITAPRLEAACAQTRFISPGRARALLDYLRHVGFLELAAPRQGRAAARYVPTRRFVDTWCLRMRRGLEATLPFEPAVEGFLTCLDDPEIAMTFARHRGAALIAALGRAQGHDLPFVRIFNHRLGGGRALAVLLSRDAGDGPFATAAVPWSLDDMVQRCGVSRVQTKRLFDDAVAEGLVRIEGNQLTWQDSARWFIVYACAFELTAMLASAAAVASAVAVSGSPADAA